MTCKLIKLCWPPKWWPLMWKTTHQEDIKTRTSWHEYMIERKNKEMRDERECIDRLAPFLMNVKLTRKENSDYIVCSVTIARDLFNYSHQDEERQYIAEYVARSIEREVRTLRILPERKDTREEKYLRGVLNVDRSPGLR